MGTEVLQVAFWGILIAACVQPAKVLNSILGNGILPSGGDTKFVLVSHLIGSYLVGLPVAVCLGIFAGLHAWGVFGARALEEIIKVIFFLLRFRTPAWYQKSLDGLSNSASAPNSARNLIQSTEPLTEIEPVKRKLPRGQFCNSPLNRFDNRKRFAAVVMKRKREKIPSKKEAERSKSNETKIVTVVGLGASAGGLEAFSELLKNLPVETGLAFVFVQHLDPHHSSQLVQILTRETTMPVKEATDGEILQPNQVYIMPPNRELTLEKGALRLWERPDIRGRHLPIDRFFASVAEEQGSLAIGVVLSGTASDGTRGLSAIKEKGGITIAQDERSARFSSMPSSAISSGNVDLVLTPQGIARELARVSGHSYVKAQTEPKTSRDGKDKILALLLAATGVDFAQYRHTTLLRRIQRRMVLNRTEDFDAYIDFLEKNPDELEALYQEVLIHVTSFFREPETFETLRENVFPKLVKGRHRDDPVRIWLPGSSTGEEVYSIAISLFEFFENSAVRPAIQIFGTDVSQRVVEKARSGIFGEAIESDVSSERLRRFFTRIDRGYRINKPIRDLCVFARQDVTRDPPFSKMDLISCRNVMIYFEPELQRRLIPLFHYALKPSGFLLLGSAESIGRFSNLFDVVAQKSKLFRKRPGHRHFSLVGGFPIVPYGPSSKKRKGERS